MVASTIRWDATVTDADAAGWEAEAWTISHSTHSRFSLLEFYSFLLTFLLGFPHFLEIFLRQVLVFC
jgi:hypothetical protein